jgi:hypothetical protein
VIFVDALGLGRVEPTVAASPVGADDPCALRQPLPIGSDNVCVFQLARAGGRPLLVDLDQRWTGNVLMQWLNVRPSGSADSLHFVYAQTAGAGTARVLRVFPLRSATGDEHLGYMIGRCGAPACPVSDLVVVGDDGARMRTLLSVRLGGMAEVQLRDDGLTSLEAWFPPGATTPGGFVARRFVWGGAGYTLRDMSMLPPPSPSASPR